MKNESLTTRKMQDICIELRSQALKNLTKYGRQSFDTLGLALAEETGEVCQAILQAKYENADSQRIREEAVDTAALCLQIILNIDEV